MLTSSLVFVTVVNNTFNTSVWLLVTDDDCKTFSLTLTHLHKEWLE